MRVSIPQLTFFYLVIYGLFSRYIEKFFVWNAILMLVFAVNFAYMLRRGRITKNRKTIFLFGLSFFLILLSGFFGQVNDSFADNFKCTLYPAAAGLCVMNLSLSDQFERLIKKYVLVFDAMWLINLGVLALQCTGSGFMIKSSWLSINRFYEDQCCGLFGNSGTHELCLFAAFILIINLYMAVTANRNRIKRNFILFTAITELIHFALSTLNDNISAFIIIPMFFVLFLVLNIQWKNNSVSRIVFSYGKYILLVIVLLMILLNIPITKEFLNSTFIDRLDKIFNYSSFEVSGGNERLSIFFYALAKDTSWRLGTGFGSWGIHSGGYFNYLHFGLSNIGSFTLLGGIWLYITYCLFISSLLETITVRNTGKSRVFFINLFVVVILTVYTVLFSSPVLMLWFCLLFSIFGLLRKHYQKTEVESNEF